MLLTHEKEFFIFCFNFLSSEHGHLENTGHVNKKRARKLKAAKVLSRCLFFSAQNCVNSKETFKANSHRCTRRFYNLRLMFNLIKR